MKKIDDLMTNQNQDTVGNYYIRGAYTNWFCVHVPQKHHKLPGQIVIINYNSLDICSIKKELLHIYDDMFSNYMSRDEFTHSVKKF